MIISHKHKYIYLEPTLVESSRGYQRFFENGLIDKDDIATGIYILDNYYIVPQNCEKFPTTLEEYSEKCDNDSLKASSFLSLDAEFLSILHSALTLKEAEMLGILTKSQIYEYKIFQIIRNPVDRLISGFIDSIERKGIETSVLDHFLGRIDPNPIHHTWKTQSELSDGYNININYILFEDFSKSIADTLKLKFDIGLNNPNAVQRVSNKRRIIYGQLGYPLLYRGYPNNKRDKFLEYYKNDIDIWSEIYKLYTGEKPVLFDEKFDGIY